MNFGIIAQSIWQEYVIAPILLDIVTALSLVILSLFLVLFAWRLILIRRAKAEEKRRDKSEIVIFSYLNDEINLFQVRNYLEENPQFIFTFVEICIDLQKNLEGDLESKIQEIFIIGEIRSYFREKLHSDDAGQITRALIFFKHCHLLSQQTVQKIHSLINHKSSDIALASALALFDSKKISIQFPAFEEICKREDITPIAILELLLIFAETDSPDFQQRGEKIIQILKSDNLPLKFRLVLIKGMGAIGFVAQAPVLFKILINYLNNSKEPNEKLVGALIEALGRLNDLSILPVIRKLIKTGNNSVCIACAKALSSLSGDDSIELLEILFRHPDREVRHEAMKQLLKIGAPALDKLAPAEEDPPIEKDTLREISQVQEYFYD